LHLSWRKNLFAVTAATFIGFTGFTLVMPFLPLYFQQLGVTDVGELALWSGVSLGVTPAITALMSPFWGRLADRFGRKIMIERSLASFIVVMAAMAFVNRPWHVFALRALQGLFAGYGALALTMAADVAPKDRTAFAIGTIQTVQRIGPAIGPVLGGTVAQIVGLRYAFFVTASFYVVALLLVFFMYKEPPIHAHHEKKRDERITFRSVLAFENFILLIVVVFGLQFVDRSFGPVLPLYVSSLGVSMNDVPLLSGILFSISAGCAALGHHLCSKLLSRGSTRAVIAGSAAIASIGMLAYVFAGNILLLFAGTPILGLAIGIASTATYTTAAAVIPPAARGTGFGLLSTGALAGLAISPVVCGLLGTLSLRAVFILDTVALVAVAVCVRRLMVLRPATATSPPTAEEV
jgi:MFS transporter, DHA1 family, multidrug resistance protein